MDCKKNLFLHGFAMAADQGHLQPAQRDAQAASARAPASWAMLGAAALVMLGSVAAVADYRRVTVIYYAKAQTRSLEQRIEAGQRSLLFAHHADYAAVTSSRRAGSVDPAFDRASHYLLDTRFMIAWSQALAAQGDIDLARNLAARLREFRKPDAKEFFAACPLGAKPAPTTPVTPTTPGTPATSDAFACEQPGEPVTWQRYLKTAR